MNAHGTYILRLAEVRASELRRDAAEYELSRAARASRISLWARVVDRAAHGARALTAIRQPTVMRAE